MEQTFFMIKPDGVQRGLIGVILSRFEARGLKIAALKYISVQKELAEKHYAEHQKKPFYDGLLQYITSGPVVVGVLEGKNAVNVLRTMMGETDPQNSKPGTIRGDFGMEVGRNIIHGSDSIESAEREISLFFKVEEIVKFSHINEQWLYE
jgi:nucleoside-diphosphate kinase